MSDRYFFQKLFLDTNYLKELYEQYSICPFLDKEDLNELGQYISQSKIKDFENNFEKAQNFINWLNKQDIKNNRINTIYHILLEYPYNDNNKIMWDDFYEFKAGRVSEDIYLLKIKGKYNDMNELKDPSILVPEVFNNITEFLNKIIIII